MPTKTSENLHPASENAKTTSEQRPFTVIVEGNIGSGKSTFLDHYRNLSDFAVYQEPVEKWRDLDGHNLLQLMYTDPDRHSYTFQSFVQLTMAQLHTAKTNKRIKIMERSLWSARYVFAENLLRSKKMAPSEFEVLKAWFEFLKGCPNEVDLSVDLVIYLRTTPEVAYERLKARARSEEKIVSLEYLQDLHNLHEKWIQQGAEVLGGGKVLVIDADKDIESVPQLYSQHEESIFDEYAKKNNFQTSQNIEKLQDISTLSSKGTGKPLGDLSNCM